VGREGFPKVFQDELINQGSGLLHLLTLEQQYLSNPQGGEKEWLGEGCQKALQKHQSERGGLQRPYRAITSRATITIHGIGHILI
jgi:hypothetical protein